MEVGGSWAPEGREDISGFIYQEVGWPAHCVSRENCILTRPRNIRREAAELVKLRVCERARSERQVPYRSMVFAKSPATAVKSDKKERYGATSPRGEVQLTFRDNGNKSV